MWTCIECENSYDANTGDVDERICNDCIEKEEEINSGIIIRRKNNEQMD